MTPVLQPGLRSCSRAIEVGTAPHGCGLRPRRSSDLDGGRTSSRSASQGGSWSTGRDCRRGGPRSGEPGCFAPRMVRSTQSSPANGSISRTSVNRRKWPTADWTHPFLAGCNHGISHGDMSGDTHAVPERCSICPEQPWNWRGPIRPGHVAASRATDRDSGPLRRCRSRGLAWQQDRIGATQVASPIRFCSAPTTAPAASVQDAHELAQLSAVLGACLSVGSAEMVSNRPFGQAQLLGDLSVRRLWR